MIDEVIAHLAHHGYHPNAEAFVRVGHPRLSWRITEKFQYPVQSRALELELLLDDCPHACFDFEYRAGYDLDAVTETMGRMERTHGTQSD